VALVGVSVSDTFEYVSNADPCKRKAEVPVDPEDASKGTKSAVVIDPGATVFSLGVLDVFLMGWIYDKGFSAGADEHGGVAIATRTNLTNIEAVTFGLRGWDNFADAKGNGIEFKTVDRFVNGRKYQAVTDECMNRLGIYRIQELGEEIKRASNVAKAEEKNSATA
jgi:hypothetical protein